MNNRYARIALLIAACSSISQAKLVPINDPVLKFIDGTPAIDIPRIRLFVARAREIQQGAKQSDGLYQGVIDVDDKFYSIRDLVKLEQNTLNNTPEQDELLAHALYRAVNKFGEISVPYAEEIQPIKHYLIKLIERWSVQRERPHTQLKTWSSINGTKIEDLRKTIPNFATFDSLLSDLTLFISDLMVSCKKSFIASFRDPKEGEVMLKKLTE